MKTSTTRQIINATTDTGPAKWVVKSSYVSASDLKASKPMTHRQATAQARAVREACGWASVERAA